MTVKEIIEQVRWCVDEETQNFSEQSEMDDCDDLYMDNIIKAKINDALMFVCLYAPAGLLDGSDEDDDTEILRDYAISATSGSVTVDDVTYYRTAAAMGNTVIPDDYQDNCGVLVMPGDFLKVARVRGKGWHRGIITPVQEDSEQYLTQFDEIAQSTEELPHAVEVNSNPRRIEIYPAEDYVELSLVCSPKQVDASSSEDTAVPLPPKVRTAFIYYLAFLVMEAYENTAKAKEMFTVAKQNLGLANNG